MTTTHQLFATAITYSRGERRAFSLVKKISTADNGQIEIYSNGLTLELHHADGREMVIPLRPMIERAELELTKPPAEPSHLENAANRIARFDQAAREHADMGAQMPEAHEEIRIEYEMSRLELWHLIVSLYQQRSTYMDICEQLSTQIHKLSDQVVPTLDKILDELGDQKDPKVLELRQLLGEIAKLRQQ